MSTTAWRGLARSLLIYRAQPWRTLDGTLRDSVWVLVLAEYKRLFPDGPPCKWKDLRAHYEICAPRPVLQRRPPRAVVCLER